MQTETVSGECTSWCTAHLWIVPAKVEGTWQTPQGELTLTQEFQKVTGHARQPRRSPGKLRGDRADAHRRHQDDLHRPGQRQRDPGHGLERNQALATPIGIRDAYRLLDGIEQPIQSRLAPPPLQRQQRLEIRAAFEARHHLQIVSQPVVALVHDDVRRAAPPELGERHLGRGNWPSSPPARGTTAA